VDFAAGSTAGGGDLLALNPKGIVPVLQLDDGKLLAEATVILLYLADHGPGAGLALAAGTM
jgi:glutathione S-transferase